MSHTDPAYEGTVPDDAAPVPEARNPLILVAAVVGALVLAAAVWFFLVTPLLLGDDAGSVQDGTVLDDDDGSPPATSGPSSPDGSATDDPDLDEELEELPLVTFEVFLARDPFEPVIPEPVSETTPTPEGAADPGEGAAPEEGEAPDTGPDGAPVDGTPGDPSPGPGVTPPGEASPPRDEGDRTCEGDEQVVCNGRALSLIAVEEHAEGRLATVQVDSTIYEVRRGDRFAGSFLVQDVAAENVTIVFGDDVVTLTVGERVLK